MTAAANVLARTALDLLERPELAQTAKVDLEKAKNGMEYRSMIPADVKPGSF